MFDEFCPIHKFVKNWHMVASIYTAMFIAIERYKAVTIPMPRWLSKNKILSFNLALWIISIISSLPTFWFSRKIKLDLIVVHSVCINDPEKIDRWFAICCAWTTLVFSVPICIMIFCYFRIRAKQKELLCIGEMNDTQIRKLQRRKKVTKRYTIISVIFLISWLPNFIWLTLRLSLPSDIIDSYWKNYFENIMRIIKWFSVTCSLNSVYFHYYFSANFKDNFIDCRPFYERKYKTFKSGLNESE
ncbi:substance-P receptor-like [Trichogramma pretiosum]|uniref:substance-P receptor-like n=1 Tax=Trichogramma pretiosum TaxID=7493 RepID=UPI0006C9573D|nr:substance-P receptor-like [Trichogramma pretiosum]